MCSVLTHPAVPLALAPLLPQGAFSPTLLLVGAACAVIPDLDVIGFQFGIGTHPVLGHRGVTHSIVFAAALSALLTFTLFRHRAPTLWVIFLFLFVSTLSHPLLDMMTNGGRGVALWAPFLRSACSDFSPREGCRSWPASSGGSGCLPQGCSSWG